MSPTKQRFNIVSLGCARNLVDSEVMAGLLQQNQYEMVHEPADADVVLVNTCGFIDAAKAESIDTILEISRLKEEGKIKKLVVAGCLAQRYPQELAKELPEVDLFIGTGEVPKIADILRRQEADDNRRQYVGIPQYLYDHATPRVRATPSYTAFLKVSEGCDHKCAFCIIPQLRGPHRSRSIDSVVNETALLAQGGVKEINLIAQDLTAYGRDRKDGTTLFGLLKKMIEVPEVVWIRLLYAYPNFLDEPLLKVIRESDKICKYIDIPFQHISRRLLQRMRRGKSGSAVRETVEKLREAIPGAHSSDLTHCRVSRRNGRRLWDAVRLCRRDSIRSAGHLQVFRGGRYRRSQYGWQRSPKRRKRGVGKKIMDLQATISQKKNKALIGTIDRVMIETVDSESGKLVGRTQAHAPEVDGVVFADASEAYPPPRPGDIVDVKITDALEYDLMGEILHA